MLTERDIQWIDKIEKIIEDQDVKPDTNLLLAIYFGLQEVVKNENKELIKEVLMAVDYESGGQTEAITDYLRKKYVVEVE